LSRSNRRKGEGEKEEAGILDAVGGEASYCVDFSLSLFLLFDLGSGCR
jgi:hypothetical protein